MKIIDLFCGIGGFRIAFENHGAECVFSSDIDRYAQETYFTNFGEVPAGDITKIDAKDIPDFDILCGGFPCQAFSIAGKRRGFEDTRGTLFFDVARILKEKQPKAFLLENVKGLVNHDKGETIKVIEKTLGEIGYNFIWKVINAKDYGVPQHRERWYCIGFRKDLGIIPDESLYPLKSTKEVTIGSILEKGSVDKSYNISDTVRTNITNFSYKYKDVPDRDDILAYEIRKSRCQFKTNGISPCLTAKMGTGGNNVPVVVKLGRKLTENECLRIMGFPKNYKIKKGQQAYKQIGNSVVVPVLDAIANNMLRVLRANSKA